MVSEEPVVLVDKAELEDKVELEETVPTQHMLELLGVLSQLMVVMPYRTTVEAEDIFLTVKVHMVPYTLVITLVTDKKVVIPLV